MQPQQAFNSCLEQGLSLYDTSSVIAKNNLAFINGEVSVEAWAYVLNMINSKNIPFIDCVIQFLK